MTAHQGFVIVEDNATVLAALLRRIEQLPGHPVRVRVLDHTQALATSRWSADSCYLVAALRHPRVQDVDPTVPLLGGPDVVAHLRDSGVVGPVIVYGSRADWPEVNITSRQAGADAVIEEDVLIARFPVAVSDPLHSLQVPAPTGEDFALLGLNPDAKIWDAITAMRHIRARDSFPHGDAWERVALTDPMRKIEDRTREYINDRVGPLLGITDGHARHKRIAVTIAKIVGLPADRSVRDSPIHVLP